MRSLALSGFAFGSVLIPEKDLTDKIDDASFLAIGIVALVWYLAGTNRFKLSRLPNLLSGLAVIMQIVGVVLEHHDKEAFGDNIGGMILFVPLFILLWVQFGRTRSVASG